MKPIHIFLLLAMGFVIFCMVSCPGIYDSRDVHRAWTHYHATPNEETRKELVRAKESANHFILGIESFLALILVVQAFAFFRAGKIQSADTSKI